jgi:hypothetical protein
VGNFNGRSRSAVIGAADAIALADARKLAAELMLEVIRGKDPAAERRAARGAGTFAEMANRYVEEYAKKKNKSWTLECTSNSRAYCCAAADLSGSHATGILCSKYT